ncbi:DUF1799 domain-containing protein [Cardiobacterium sp. AH-315-I02]|nr:DUF1799 domain-containing protein [Cardiobacterium sp. AH-315-I02]
MKCSDDFLVLANNWDTVLLFLSLQTQWRPQFTGFDYSAITQYLTIMNVKHKKRKFKNLQIMELAALEIIHNE